MHRQRAIIAATMPLAPGAKLGTYEITGTLGAGGMGECTAPANQVGRSVAIKASPMHSPPTTIACRVRTRGQVLASLNYPQIAALYGTESAAANLPRIPDHGVVEGEILPRTAAASVPSVEALTIALQSRTRSRALMNKASFTAI